MYNYFKDIYSGNAYSSQISTDGNELYKFIMSSKQQNGSFRSYIIELCNFNYNKCRDAYKNKYPKLKYPDEYYKDLEKIIKNTEKNEKYKSKHPWPDNLLGI